MQDTSLAGLSQQVALQLWPSMVHTVPELDRAVAEMKKSNRLFKQRLLLNKLTIDDVEEIVYRATYGIIKLELSDIEY